MPRLIGNRFQLGDQLGTGGMGTVYKGIDTQTNAPVAIKLLKPEAIAADPDMIERFQREGEALRQLNHPNIVKLLDTVEHDNQHYLIMEYVSGGDLRSLLQQEGQLTDERTLAISLELADALTRAHHLKIIHRDLKPANVLIADDGTPRLTDFGVAYMMSKESITGTGLAIGTPHYMSPEALRGEVVDNRADIWSFGVMLFEMLSGELPFTGKSAPEIVTAILRDPLPDLERLRSGAPIALVDLIYRMLEKDRNARIRSVRVVGAELEAILQGVDVDAPTRPAAIVAGEPRRFATPTPSTDAPEHNLPAQTTPFVGREQELVELVKLIDDPQIRLITILAPGGMGKSRLALEIAQRLVGKTGRAPALTETEFHHGVWLVDLAPLRDPEHIITAIADATGFQFQLDGRTTKQQILDFLRNKQTLLIMDNYEHMLDGTAIVSDILQAAPGVTVLATSRERLNLTEEQLFPLGGMDFPDWGMPEDTLGYAAVKLFMHSAKRIRPDFDLAADDLPYLARICHLVAGMPLAIVLAATWVEMLSLREIAEEITEGLEVLESELRDIPERQRSIQAVFEYSWQQLDEKERHVFAKASVFRGGMTRKAAQAVTGAKLRTLQSLLNKGLLRRDPDIGRFHIHELLRQYAEVRLEEKGEVAITQDAHMDYYADALQGRLMDLRGHRQLQALDDIASDFENVGAAWHWALKQKHYDVIGRMVEVVARFGDLRTRWQDIEPLITKAIEQLAAEPHNVHQAFLGRLLIHQGWAFIYVGDYSTAQAVVCRGQELVEHNHDQGGIAFARISLGMILLNQGKWERAGGRFHQGLNIYRSTGDQHGIARCLNGLGAVALRQAQYEQAEDYLQQSLVIYRAMGDQHGMANCLGNLSFLSRQQGQPERAEGYLQQCLTIMRAIGNQRGIGTSLNSLGALAWFQQKYERAEEYFLQCYAIYLAIGEQRAIGQSLNNLGMVADARGDVTAAQDYYEQSIACKRKIGLRHDLAYTLVELGILQARQADPAATETLREALNIASELEVTRLMLWALAGIAQLCASNENLIRAVELASLAQSQSSGDSELQDRLRPLEDDLRAKLGKETYNAAWERGRQLDLETVVQELLEEFGEK